MTEASPLAAPAETGQGPSGPETSGPDTSDPLASGPLASITAVSGVVRAGEVVVELVSDAPLATPVTAHLLANDGIVGSVTLAAGTTAPVAATLSVPLSDMPELLDSVDVLLEADGVRAPAARDAGFLLPRTLVRTAEEFEANVMRKHVRVRDRETVCYAARQALRRFPGDLRTCAVSLAVIGYRIAENPDGANDAMLAELTEAADRLIAGIDASRAAEARWSSTLNVMMFNVFATLRQPEMAVKYLLQLFADRRLVHVEPMCAFNCMIGILALGYIYRLQRRTADAQLAWGEAGEVFGTSAMNMPKTFGALHEFEFIQQSATFCVASIAQLAGTRDKRMRVYSTTDVAVMCLRAPTKKGINRTALFLTELKPRGDLLPPAEAALAFTYRPGEAR